ncbi:MAG: ATP-binding protein [Bacteroidota bacterium]
MPANDTHLYAVVLIAALLLIAFVGYFVAVVIRQQRAVSKWQQARIAAEIQTLEKERRRIAGDLHDELGPMLSAIKLQINHLEPTDETETAVLEKSSTQIDGIIQRFREISYDLLPNTLVRKGFIKATEEFVSKLKLLHPLAISFVAADFKLEAEREVNLYRMVQEIVQNTIKHARATRLEITVEKRPSSIVLKTKDDGIGFGYTEKKQMANGLGLMNLQSRAEVLGGHLSVQTQPGMGTAYEIEIPI